MQKYSKKNTKKYIYFSLLLYSLIAFLIFSNLGADYPSQSNPNSEVKDGISKNIQKISIKIDSPDRADLYIGNYLRNLDPLISDTAVERIISEKNIKKILVNDTLGIIEFDAVMQVPKYYLDPSPNILWVLNIPELKTHFYQIYNGDTILIDSWDCSPGDPKTKTYTGRFSAWKIRNWPSWKDPDSDSPPVPPGLKNPLGLFTIHFDMHSTRQFHGTNIDNPQIGSYGCVSHGCIRNNSENITKLKEFIIEKVIKSEDLTYWLESKKSMDYVLKEQDKLPFIIIYKTFAIGKDENGNYITFFKDFYGYDSSLYNVNTDDSSLITASSFKNILNELRWKCPSVNVPDEKLKLILEKLIAEHENYEKYYFKEIFLQYGLN